MNQAVWKVRATAGWQNIDMPAGAQVLHVAAQGNDACIWFLCDPEAKTIKRGFIGVLTGERYLGAGAKYLGTALLDDGAFVLHIFEGIQ